MTNRRGPSKEELEADRNAVRLERVTVADGFAIGGWSNQPYFTDGSGNAYIVQMGTGASNRERALANMLLALHAQVANE